VNDKERLARTFDVALTRVAVPTTIIGGLFMMIGVTASLGVGGAALALFGASRLYDEHKLRKGLAEVNQWGFPVHGYREWLLANDPAFDVELERDTGLDILRSSAAAVDRTVTVERRSDRVVRFLTRPVQLSVQDPAVIGDRRLLFELHDRVLAPLHSDAGIVGMRMGDNATLASLVASKPKTETAFRDQAMTAPPALQELVHVGTAQMKPAREAKKRVARAEAIILASGEKPTSGCALAFFSFIGVSMGASAWGYLGGFLALAGIMGGGIAITRLKAKRLLQLAGGRPYPIEGYDDWLLSGRPILDVETREPARDVVTSMLGPYIDRITWIDDTLFRIETESRIVEGYDNVATFYGGNAKEFLDLRERFLDPLHTRVGIVAVRMGGYVQRRV